MQLEIIYINNDPDIFVKKCALIKRLEKNNIIFSDRAITRQTGIIFLTVAMDKAQSLINDNKDLLKLFNNGAKKAIVIA